MSSLVRVGVEGYWCCGAGSGVMGLFLFVFWWLVWGNKDGYAEDITSTHIYTQLPTFTHLQSKIIPHINHTITPRYLSLSTIINNLSLIIYRLSFIVKSIQYPY